MNRTGGLALAVVAVLLAVATGWLVSQHVRAPQLQPQRPLAGLPLKGAAGSTVTVDDYRGKVVLLVFGCVSCWPADGSVLRELDRALGHLRGQADEVQVLVVSVVPERDTTASVVARVTAADPRFVGLVGSPEVIRRVAALGLAPEGPDDAPVMVLDRRGQLRLTFPFRFSAPSIAEDLAALLRPMRS